MKENFKSQHFSNRFCQPRSGRWQTFLASLLITLLVHLLVIVLLPDEYFMRPSMADSDQDDEIELLLEPFDPETLRYVEANPEAPENEPDRKNTYSFRAQQAADEAAEVSKGDAPKVDGEDLSQKIVQGSVEQPEPTLSEGGVFAPPGEFGEDSTENDAAVPASTFMPPMPLPSAPDFIKQKPEVDEGPGSSLQISGLSQQVSEEHLDTDQPIQLYRPESESPQNQDTSAENSGTVQAKPMPRKRVTLPPDLVYGPLMRSEGSTGRRGRIAIDATFSQFGEYERQFYAAVQAGWYQEIDFFQPIDTSTRVVVRFRIQSDGTIDEVTILHSTASEIATLICQMALTKRSPFRPWTEEMVQVFGDERVMEVAFSYL